MCSSPARPHETDGVGPAASHTRRETGQRSHIIRNVRDHVPCVLRFFVVTFKWRMLYILAVIVYICHNRVRWRISYTSVYAVYIGRNRIHWCMLYTLAVIVYIGHDRIR